MLADIAKERRAVKKEGRRILAGGGSNGDGKHDGNGKALSGPPAAVKDGHADALK